MSNPENQLYAEVALDLNVRGVADRLFTYEIPAHLKSEIFIGSQVLVPFGNQEMLSAFVVSIRDKNHLIQSASKKAESSSVLPDKTRPITEVLDSNPLFEAKYMEFLYWVSEYYLCSITEVLQAAVPADIGPRSKRFVRLLELAEECNETNPLLKLFDPTKKSATNKEEAKIKSALAAAAKNLSIKALKERSGLSGKLFYAGLARLRRRGEIEIYSESKDAAGPKIITYVRGTGMEGKSKRHNEIISILARNKNKLTISELTQEAKCSRSTVNKMVEDGLLSLLKEDSIRDPLKNYSDADISENRPELTGSQKSVLELLLKELDKKLLDKQSKSNNVNSEEPNTERRDSKKNTSATPADSDLLPWLLYGVTGSGKTEVYLRLIEACLKQNCSALLMVPEISLTPQLAGKLVGRFGKKVAVWHSGLSAGERFDTWKQIQEGKLKLILGARSAILANIPRLGLIILDEEHDSSYKQTSPNPRYSARHLALERARRESCLAVFGSATPDASTYFNCMNADRVLRLPERVFKQALPESVFVDMKSEFERRNKSIISAKLKDELAACLERKDQAILLINRRGYASQVFCRACGKVASCKNCSVSLVFHARSFNKDNDENLDGRLSCHHCGFNTPASKICSYCKGPFLKQAGMGTQRVEEELRLVFPNARILRLDSDVSSRKGAYDEIFSQFSKGEADVLIGTQMIAKGLDIARVTLVGVLAADAAFSLPDFRTLERGFQLLTQVSGRAGRGSSPGKVILQTHNTELPALKLAKAQDYDSFIKDELASRKQFDYPPFSQLIRILASSEDQLLLQSYLERLAEELANYLEEIESIKILGPAPCLIERIKGLYREQLIIKNQMGEIGLEAIASFLRGRKANEDVRLSIDVDPVDLI